VFFASIGKEWCSCKEWFWKLLSAGVSRGPCESDGDGGRSHFSICSHFSSGKPRVPGKKPTPKANEYMTSVLAWILYGNKREYDAVVHYLVCTIHGHCQRRVCMCVYWSGVTVTQFWPLYSWPASRYLRHTGRLNALRAALSPYQEIGIMVGPCDWIIIFFSSNQALISNFIRLIQGMLEFLCHVILSNWLTLRKWITSHPTVKER